MRQRLCHARVLTDTGFRDDLEVDIEAGRILRVATAASGPAPRRVIDLDGGYLVPGFNDCQVNGGGVVLFNNTPTLEGVRANAFRCAPEHGLSFERIRDELNKTLLTRRASRGLEMMRDTGLLAHWGLRLDAPDDRGPKLQMLGGYQVETNSPGRLSRIELPILSDIPVIGPVLFDQTIIVYLMYVAVALIHVALFHSRWGLRVRAVGEHPKAADTLGIQVNRTRFRNVLLGGMVAGFGGSFFTLGNVGSFSQEMSAGQGFIALAAMIFGRWSPLGALGAALLFGFANNLQSVLGIIGTPIPSEFMLMLPYILTIFAVAGLVGRVRAPAADGVPYVKS